MLKQKVKNIYQGIEFNFSVLLNKEANRTLPISPSIYYVKTLQMDHAMSHLCGGPFSIMVFKGSN